MGKKLNRRNFKPYGWIIDCPGKKNIPKGRSLFSIVLRERRKTGWRIAYLVLGEKELTKLEQHPDSFESFEPISGKTLLYVAPAKNPAKIECFLLDKPVILDKGIWHGVITLGAKSEIKITENAAVMCKYCYNISSIRG
ncbi:MAG: hypothetical protein WC321_01730 [Candidatus Omnitrophota bacterium]|jgi:ureidoglycolate hydrolase